MGALEDNFKTPTGKNWSKGGNIDGEAIKVFLKEKEIVVNKVAKTSRYLIAIGHSNRA